MIKSLPIENILSKVSLSSKKSIQKNSSDFGDMLKKAAVTAKDDVEHENVPNNHHKFEDKHEAHSKSNKSKTDNDNNDKVGCACCDSRGYTNNAQGNAEEKKAGNKAKKNMADKAVRNSKLPDMKNKHLESKNMKLKKEISIKNFKKTDSLNLKNGSEKVKNVSLKITRKQVSLNGITAKETKEEVSDVKNLKEVKNNKNVSKKMSQKMHLKTIKNQHETGKILVLSKSSDVNESKIKPQKKDVILNDKENIKISKKDKNLLAEHVLNTKQIGYSNQNSLQFRKIKQTNDKANLEADAKNNQKESSKIKKADVKVVNIEEIKNKYAKKLNIEKIDVSDKNAYKKEEKIQDTKLKHGKIRTVDINKKAGVVGQSSKQSVTETNKTKTNVVVIQEGNKALKIKTIKNAKSDKTIKVIETTQSEKSNETLEVSDAVSKKTNKIKISSNVKISVNDKISVKVVQNNSKSHGFNLVESLKEFAHSTGKKDDKNTIIKSDLSLSQPQQAINGQLHDTSQINSINRPYPMDKVIENIDKMINLKPPFNNTITIKLNPPHIGALQLQVKMDRDRNISAVITADDKNVLKIVNSHIDGLKTYLNSQGIKVSHVDVHNGFHEQANFGGGQNQGMPGNGNGQHNSAGGNRFNNFNSVLSNDEAMNFKGDGSYKKGHSVEGLDITV